MRTWIALAESLHSSHEWKWYRRQSEMACASFQSGNRQVIVTFNGSTTVLINFEVDRVSTKTNGGDSRAIFSTVLDIIRDYIRQNRSRFRALTFAASAYEPSRVRLYQTMLRILARDDEGFTVEEDPSDGDSVQFWLKAVR